MSSKKIIVALALLLSATSASLAMDAQHSQSGYGTSSGYAAGGGGGYNPGEATQR